MEIDSCLGGIHHWRTIAGHEQRRVNHARERRTDTFVLACWINPEASLPDDRVAIKDYSENKGVAEALVKAGVLGEEDDAYELPFPVYKLRLPLPAGLVSKATILAMK